MNIPLFDHTIRSEFANCSDRQKTNSTGSSARCEGFLSKPGNYCWARLKTREEVNLEVRSVYRIREVRNVSCASSEGRF